MHSYQNFLQWLPIQTITKIQEQYQHASGQTEPIVMIGGLITSKKIISTKKGDRRAFLQVEDITGNAEIIVFPKLFAKIEKQLEEYSLFIIKGTLDTLSAPVCKILANEVCPIDLFFNNWPNIQGITLTLPQDAQTSIAQDIKNKLLPGKTALNIIFCEEEKTLLFKINQKFTITADILQQLNLDHEIKVKIIL